MVEEINLELTWKNMSYTVLECYEVSEAFWYRDI